MANVKNIEVRQDTFGAIYYTFAAEDEPSIPLMIVNPSPNVARSTNIRYAITSDLNVSDWVVPIEYTFLCRSDNIKANPYIKSISDFNFDKYESVITGLSSINSDLYRKLSSSLATALFNTLNTYGHRQISSTKVSSFVNLILEVVRLEYLELMPRDKAAHSEFTTIVKSNSSQLMRASIGYLALKYGAAFVSETNQLFSDSEASALDLIIGQLHQAIEDLSMGAKVYEYDRDAIVESFKTVNDIVSLNSSNGVYVIDLAKTLFRI